MKVIDLLNKIANGEEVPKYIIGRDSLGEKEEYIYNGFWYTHTFENPDGEEDYYYMRRDINNLNDEVEIIEEDKKIVKIGKLNQVEDKQNLNNYILRNKINEIIDKINKE